MIGVLTAIILPLSMNAGKPQAAVAKAKSFYFGSQRILIQYRADSPELQTGYLSYKKDAMTYTINTGDYMYICAKAEKNNGFTELKLAKLSAPADGTAANPATGYTQFQFAAEITASSTDHSLLDKLNTFSTDDDEGYYYALVDDQCKVIMTYWCETFIDDISKSTDTASTYSKTTIFPTDNYYVDGYLFGAYPERYSMLGYTMCIDYSFRYTCSRRSVILKIVNFAPTVPVGAFVYNYAIADFPYASVIMHNSLL